MATIAELRAELSSKRLKTLEDLRGEMNRHYAETEEILAAISNRQNRQMARGAFQRFMAQQGLMLSVIKSEYNFKRRAAEKDREKSPLAAKAKEAEIESFLGNVALKSLEALERTLKQVRDEIVARPPS